MKLDAFIFTLDGVLLQSGEIEFQAWKRLVDDVGAEFDRDTFQKMRLVSRRDAAEILFSGQNPSDAEIRAGLARQNNDYLEIILKMSPDDIRPGVVDLLKDLRSQDIMIGLCSEHQDAKKALDAVGLTPLVDVIADGYSVKETLPEPDLLLFIAHEMGVKPENCVVVDDRPKGIIAANRAGMYAVGVGSADDLPGSDVVYPSLDAITNDQIRTDLAKARPY